jgi:hypothetical protein
VDGAETAEVQSSVDPRFFGHGLYVPMEQVVSIERFSGLVGKHKVIWFAELLIL